jgi:hypothetical protein
MAPEALESVDYRGGPRLLLFADSAAGLDRARGAAEQAGSSIAAAEPIEGAAERLAEQIHVDSVLVEAERDSDALWQLLDELENRARCGRHQSVVVAPFDMIDPVFARAPHSDVQLLCLPSPADRVSAVALAAVRRRAILRDGKEDIGVVLQQLSDEAARIAGALASLAGEEAAAGGLAGGEGEGAQDGPTVDAALIRSIIRARRLRDSYFKGEIFADPAWDMLLDLMAARLEKHRVAVSSLCIAAAVPPTTALRWIKTLTDRGLFIRCADPADGRRVYIELSDEAARALTNYIRAAQRISPIGL